MKITLEPTDQVDLVDGVACRLWKGCDDENVEVHAYIRAVSPKTHDSEVHARYEAELRGTCVNQAVLLFTDLDNNL